MGHVCIFVVFSFSLFSHCLYLEYYVNDTFLLKSRMNVMYVNYILITAFEYLIISRQLK